MIIGHVVSLHSASVYAWLASTSDDVQVIMSSCTDMNKTDDRNYKPLVKIQQVSVSLQWQRYALQWMPFRYFFNIYKLNIAVISQKRTVKMCQRGIALWVVRVHLLTPTHLAPVFITSYRTRDTRCSGFFSAVLLWNFAVTNKADAFFHVLPSPL